MKPDLALRARGGLHELLDGGDHIMNGRIVGLQTTLKLRDLGGHFLIGSRKPGDGRGRPYRFISL